MTSPRPAGTPQPDRSADLALALALADEADALTLSRFQAVDLRVETKPNATPVSDADRAVEATIRARIRGERRGDAVLGEEEGLSGSAARRWVVDPVDGTKNFVRGVPVWATLLALEVDGEVVVGVVSAPALGRRWWAVRGGGAYLDSAWAGRRGLAVSGVGALGDAFLSYSSLSGWAEHGRRAGFDTLSARAWRTRAFGDFYSHVLVAEGAVDLSCEPEVSHWDLAALQVVVEEAGGRFTDLGGRRGPDGGSVLCSNGLLHDEALTVLAGH